MRTHLFLTFSRGGWGEAAFAIHLAYQLRGLGEDVHFISHQSNVPLIRGAGFDFTEFGNHIGQLALPLIQVEAQEKQVASLVMCDFLTCDGLLRTFGLAGQELLEIGIPLLAIDTWGHKRNLDSIDLFVSKKIEVRPWISKVPTIAPCPILKPGTYQGTCGFASNPIHISKTVRKNIRKELGLKNDEIAVLFCTAQWQQTDYADEAGDTCAQRFPELLAEYFKKLDCRLRLIHVGPKRISSFAPLGERYKWLPPLGSRFDLILGASDILLSANISASTISKAIASQIPVVVLENSCAAKNPGDAKRWLGSRLRPTVENWLDQMAIIYPFSLWPIGFADFLKDRMFDNPYCDAIIRVEWLDEDAVLNTILTIAFENTDRSIIKAKQVQYQEQINSLPKAVEAFQEMLETSSCRL